MGIKVTLSLLLKLHEVAKCTLITLFMAIEFLKSLPAVSKICSYDAFLQTLAKDITHNSIHFWSRIEINYLLLGGNSK